jgi:hypothetical protein
MSGSWCEVAITMPYSWASRPFSGSSSKKAVGGHIAGHR